MEAQEYDDWYNWGTAVLYLEMAIAILVTAFSLYMAFNGQTAGIA